MKPRYYQQAAIDAIDKHLCEKSSNPCVVIPTGGGKSPAMAWTMMNYKRQYRDFRAIVLAHTKELVAQNADKLLQVWPDAPLGIYAAGLKRRDTKPDLLFASIDSIYKKAFDLDPFDLIIVDEAHRIPPSGDGKYRRFIADCKIANPKSRVVGMTATPYRMGGGDVCHRDHILNEICYEIGVAELIEKKFLCPLRSKVGDAAPDLANVKKRGGEYVTNSLSSVTDVPELVRDTIAEAVPMLADRKAIIFFCVDIPHCQHVSEELAKHGIEAPCVTGKTPAAERDKITERFVSGEIRAVCNVNVLTEGFDATRTDAIVLLRPTQSKGLYYQMVGRGLRLDDRKDDCLVLDFAECIHSHGPIDHLGGDGVRLTKCPECKEMFSRATRQCPACGWKIPKKQIEREEAEEAQRKMHNTVASRQNIISNGEPEELRVDAVKVHRHVKPGKPDSLRVTYRCGLRTFSEWVCLDHHGPAGSIAHGWWKRRFAGKTPTVDTALQDIFLETSLSAITTSIKVKKKGKYHEIVGVTLCGKPEPERTHAT